MANCIIWSIGNEGVVITHMGQEATLEETAAHRDLLIEHDLFTKAQFCAIVSDTQLPTERYFRPAWVWNGTAVTHDLEKCRARHLQKLRKMRRPLFALTDPKVMIALEKGDNLKVEQLRAYRQSLRDMPLTIQSALAAAKTPEEIRAIRPTCFDAPTP